MGIKRLVSEPDSSEFYSEKKIPTKQKYSANN